jgi:hypothetical protein
MGIVTERKKCMKITLPDESIIELDKSLTHEERLVVVNDLVLRWNDHITKYKNAKSNYFLACLSNYLCYEKKVKEQEGDKDGEEKV